MALFGLSSSDVVGVATDVLSTETQKQVSARVKEDIEVKDRARAAPIAPEVSLDDRIRVTGAAAPDRSQGFAASNASQFTSGLPLKA